MVQNGTLLVQNGTISAQNGTILHHNGTVLIQNGTLLFQNGTILVQNGALIDENGTILNHNVTVLVGNGTLLVRNGTLLVQNGIILNHKISITSQEETLFGYGDCWMDSYPNKTIFFYFKNKYTLKLTIKSVNLTSQYEIVEHQFLNQRNDNQILKFEQVGLANGSFSFSETGKISYVSSFFRIFNLKGNLKKLC